MTDEENLRPDGSAEDRAADTGRTAESGNERADTGGNEGGNHEPAGSAKTDDTNASDNETSRAGAEATDDAAELRAQVEALQAENTDLKNQYLRKQADVENFRRRMIRDKEDAVNYANQQLLLDLTAIIDDFERAISSAEESRDYDAFHDGVVLIEKQLTGMLERKWGLKRFESEGLEFDPQRHQAVTTEPAAPDQVQPMVVEEYQRGYLLHDRVLRSAKVKVSMPGSD